MKTFLPITSKCLASLSAEMALWCHLDLSDAAWTTKELAAEWVNKRVTPFAGTKHSFSAPLKVQAHIASICLTAFAGSSMAPFTGSATWLDHMGCKTFRSLGAPLLLSVAAPGIACGHLEMARLEQPSHWVRKMIHLVVPADLVLLLPQT